MLVDGLERNKSRIVKAAEYTKRSKRLFQDRCQELLKPIWAEMNDLTHEATGANGETLEVIRRCNEDDVHDGFCIWIGEAVCVAIWITREFHYHVMVSAKGNDTDLDVLMLEHALQYVGEFLAPYIELRETS